MFTYVVYFGLLLCCYFLSVWAERFNNKNYLMILVLLLTFVSGFRGDSVGIDTVNYINKFETIAAGYPEYAYGLEEGFVLICSLLLKLCSHTTFLFVVFAGLTNFFILDRMWDLKDIASLPCMVLCYYTQFFFMSMNIMRQFLAIAILFYASRYLAKKKYLLFGGIILLTSFFVHRSALMGFLYFVLEVTQWKSLSKGQKMILGCGMMAAPVALLYVLSSISKYEHYFQDINANLGFMIPVKIVFLFVVLLQQNNFRISIRKPRLDEDRRSYRISTVKIYYFVGLAISMLGYFFSFMDRIGWYFYIFEGCCLGTVWTSDHQKYKQIIVICMVVLLGYSFIDAILSGSQGVVPFRFVWNS